MKACQRQALQLIGPISKLLRGCEFLILFIVKEWIAFNPGRGCVIKSTHLYFQAITLFTIIGNNI